MTHVLLRDATTDDLTAIEGCVQRAYGHYVERIGRPPAPMLEDCAALIAHGVVRVATVDGDVQGLIVAWAEPDHFYVDNVAVEPGAQGLGVGRVLLNEAERAAVSAGRHEIRLYTNELMTENVDYYPRRGYMETHRAEAAGFRRVYFAKPVSPAGNAAVSTSYIDNGTFRVTEWRFAPGAATGFHRHQYDYVVVPMTTGELEIVNIDGTTRSPLTAGIPYARVAGVEHDVRNPNPYEFTFIEVERLA